MSSAGRAAASDGSAAACADHLAALGYSPLTTNLRRTQILRAQQALGPLEDATTAQLTAYLRRRYDGSPVSHGSNLDALRAYYRWAIMVGRTATDPTTGIRRPPKPSYHPRPIPEHALAEALRRAADPTPMNPAFFALVLGGVLGLRVSEIGRAHRRDLDHGVLRVLGKGSKVRYIPVPEPLASLLGEHDGYYVPGRYGPSTQNTTRRIIVRALAGEYTPHQLRHRAATAAYAKRKDLRAVQELLGHSSPSVTAVYAASTADHVRDAISLDVLPTVVTHPPIPRRLR